MIAQLKKDLHDPNILDLCSDIYYYIKPESKQSNQYIEYRILKEVLKSKKYTIIDSIELYEEDTGYYHKALRFKYSKFKGVI